MVPQVQAVISPLRQKKKIPSNFEGIFSVINGNSPGLSDPESHRGRICKPLPAALPNNPDIGYFGNAKCLASSNGPMHFSFGPFSRGTESDSHAFPFPGYGNRHKPVEIRSIDKTAEAPEDILQIHRCLRSRMPQGLSERTSYLPPIKQSPIKTPILRPRCPSGSYTIPAPKSQGPILQQKPN